MKPSKNRVMCPDCGRQKMLFESERKANDFIKWNGDDIDTHGGELRAYYCPSCCGWHVSSKEHKKSYDNQTERLIDAYRHTSGRNNSLDFVLLRETKNFDRVNESRKIYEKMPIELKASYYKNLVKKYITEYMNEHLIDELLDGGVTRKMVYNLWEEHRSEYLIKIRKAKK